MGSARTEFSPYNAVNMTENERMREIVPVTSFTLVQAGDIGVDYVAGSEGKVKTILEYGDVSKTKLLTTTTFKYQDAGFPTTVTEIIRG